MFSRKASDIALRADDPTNEAIAHLYLGRMYSEVGEWSCSDSSYRKAIDLAERMHYFDLRVGVQLLAHEYSAPDQLNAALRRIQGMSSVFDLYSAQKMDQEETFRSALIRKGLIIGLIGLMLIMWTHLLVSSGKRTTGSGSSGIVEITGTGRGIDPGAWSPKTFKTRG